MLLFLCPEARIPTLWLKVQQQFEAESKLEPIDLPSGDRRARLLGTEIQVAFISWVRLLDRLDALTRDEAVKSDIQQLLGLVQAQDDRTFLPIHPEELDPNIARREVWYAQLADDVISARGVPEGWLHTQGLVATSQRYGYGRYFGFPGVEGAFWFGVNHEKWAGNADTPLWLNANGSKAIMSDMGRALNVEVYDGWIPIHLKTGVEYQDVLNDLAAQLKAIAGIVSNSPSA